MNTNPAVMGIKDWPIVLLNFAAWRIISHPVCSHSAAARCHRPVIVGAVQYMELSIDIKRPHISHKVASSFSLK